MIAKSRSKERKHSDRSLISSIRSIGNSEVSKRSTPPKPVYKSHLLEQAKLLLESSDRQEKERVYIQSAGIIDYNDTAQSEYKPSSTLFDDDYSPFCTETNVIKIEELQGKDLLSEKKSKDYHSSTTRAESNYCLPPVYPPKPPEASQKEQTVAQEYFSSKFAEINEEEAAVKADKSDLDQSQEKEKSLTRRLKDLVKNISNDVKPAEIKRADDNSLNSRQWSSLTTNQRPEDMRSRPDVVNQRAVETSSEKNHPSSHQSLPSETYMVALYDFDGEKNKDLNFKKGDLIRLIDKKANGWWLAEADGRIGFVPSNYLVSKQEVTHN